MLTTLSQFFTILAANRAGFTAKQRGTRKGTIRRGGHSPAEVVFEILTGRQAHTLSGAIHDLFGSDRRRLLVAAASEAPTLLYIYQRSFASTWKASGKQAAMEIEAEWQAVLSVRGQMLKTLGLKDTLRGDSRLPMSLRYIPRRKR